MWFNIWIIAHILCCWVEILSSFVVWCHDLVQICVWNFGVVHFTAVTMPFSFFWLTGFNDFVNFLWKILRMENRQVLSERNLLRVNLRDPVLLLIGKMLLENQWEYLYNYACPAFPRLVRDFYGHMVWSCTLWSEGTLFRLIPGLSVLWLGSLFYQSREFLFLQLLKLPA